MTFSYLAMSVMAVMTVGVAYASIAGLVLRFAVWLNGQDGFASEVTPGEDDDLKWLWAAFFPVTMTLVITGLVLEGAGWLVYYAGKPAWRTASFFYMLSFPKRAKKTNLPRAKAVK
jgi:hypothetical protein